MLNYHDYIEPLLKKTYQEPQVLVSNSNKRGVLYALLSNYHSWRRRRLPQPGSKHPQDMFIAVYEFTVVDGKQTDFRRAWQVVTEGIYQQCGSYGSRLHRTENPTVFIGYAQWPSQEAWAANRALKGAKYQRAREQMQAWLVSSSTRYCLTVCDDHLA